MNDAFRKIKIYNKLMEIFHFYIILLYASYGGYNEFVHVL